jgi:LmbE family N-acetylglucosaminyl deacetylase
VTPRRLLVGGAHSADFVWRSAGAIATHTARGGEALVAALSYGERGESGVLWKQEGQTEENVQHAQRAEHRGTHSRKVTGNQEIRQAEAFQRLLPNVVEAL